MAILFNNHGHDGQHWVDALSALLPAMTIYQYPNIPDLNCIEYAVVWNHPKGELAKYPNLKAVLNLGAGADWLEADGNLPRVPIVRLLDPAVGLDMAHYVLHWVMHHHRGYAQYAEQQAQKKWARFQVETIENYCVTVLGLGLIGTTIAQQVCQNGYKVQAWNRSQKSLQDISCFSQQSGLLEALSKSHVVVNCLPHNEQTNKLLNMDVLSALPKGARLINVSRGGVIDYQALMALLDNDHLASAVLDTFNTEPLSQDSPLWSHKKITITPHMSGATYPQAAAKVIANNIEKMECGELPAPIYAQFDYD